MGLMIERKKTTRRKKIPESFIYEIMDGRPLYYKGYKQAIRNNLNAESIMGASTLQAFIVAYLVKLLHQVFDSNYLIFTGEPGLHINHKNNLGGDILLYDKKVFPSSKISKHYADVPAELQIEVDITAELEDITETGYIKRKTDILLEFGTKKVIWIFTSTQQVLVAEKDKDWLWINWNKPVQLWKNNSFCIGKYLEQEGVELSEE
ncbi:MAG TPA: hypothetical protein VFW07_25745 [Parafilimonas sp.]|nr:hypothetical protein [Parafilimonas sp.]